MDELGIFHANQISMRLDPHQKSQEISLFLCGINRISLVPQYIIESFFTYSGPSGILSSDRNQNIP